MKQIKYLILFLIVVGCTTDAERIRMRSELDSINVRNKNDMPFFMTDVEPYVQFFDDHGTPNDRMLAHYLLGRAYYEHNEAPMALQCYHDAIDCSDTTTADCDYAQLSRVYGQMAEIYYDQGLYREGLYHDHLSTIYAWKGGDTLTALRSYEQEGIAHNLLGHTDSSIIIIKDVAQKYERYGYHAEASIALGTIIGSLVEKGDYQVAKSYINKYESESGRFDSLGNIESGREIYYNIKGQYYLYISMLDSAEFYFRKEIREGKDYSNQHSGARGLAELYQKLHQADSTAKYYQYAYEMNDSIYTKRTSKEIERIKAMYDYTRHQENAHQESEKAILANKRLLVCLFVLLAIILLASWLYIARKEIEGKYKKAVDELYVIHAENEELKNDTSANILQITENEKRIRQLEKKLGRYSKLVYFGSEKVENDLRISPNYQKIKDIAIKGKVIQESEWNIIRQLISEYFPEYDDFLFSKLKINSVEYQICSLLRLHFKTGEIANMLDVTPSYISKVSTEILKKLFNKKGSSKELAKELKDF